MKPIKIYFAGEWGPRPEQGDLAIQNRLVSFLYPKQFTHWIELTKGKPGNIILDSGAFSAWNKGNVIDLDEYITYAHNAIDKAKSTGKNIRVVNLDVIPGKVGETKSLNAILGNEQVLAKNATLIEDSARKGLQNLKIMKHNGITPIHVYHQGEHIKWLDRMLKHTDYIGISPANDMPNDSKKKWMTSVFEYLYKNNINVDTHGFAVMIPEILRDLPWTSVDAISWLMIAATGCVIYPIGGFQNPKFKTSERPYNQILLSSKKVGKGMIGVTDNILKLFEADGYSYEQLQDYKIREEINVKTFQLFEKWLNKYKEKKEYIVQKKLFI